MSLLASAPGTQLCPPLHAFRPCRLRWGVRGGQEPVVLSGKRGARPGGPCVGAPAADLSGLGRLLLTEAALQPEHSATDPECLHQDTNSTFLEKGSLFLHFWKCQLVGQHRRGAISMVFIRRTVCGFTITGEERELGHSLTTHSNLVTEPPRDPAACSSREGLSLAPASPGSTGHQQVPRGPCWLCAMSPGWCAEPEPFRSCRSCDPGGLVPGEPLPRPPAFLPPPCPLQSTSLDCRGGRG